MTKMLNEYDKHRSEGHGHHGALKALSRRFDLDVATVARVIERACRAEDPGGYARKFERAPRSPRKSPARARSV
jgi:hypothetical protein